MGQPNTPKALALGVSLSLACGLMPAAAFAEEAPATDDGASSSASDSPVGVGAAPSATDEAPQPADYDKADFYSESAVGGMLARSLAAPLALSYQPVQVSEEMKYFAKHESGRNYDQGLSRGDGYHAMGYYQFDNRYVLTGFLTTCYQYDPSTYSMFGWVMSTDITGDLYDEDAGRLTEVGQKLNDSWHAAYAADPDGFSSLQDSYAYTTFYMPAETYLKSRGIDISDRSDCVKGLCWGLSSLFGPGGWKKFVGGVSDGYDWNGTYHYLSERYEWPGAGLTNEMTDLQFVTALCTYVTDNVSVFYKGQPGYHQGWENRYRAELEECKAFIAEHGDSRDTTASDPVKPGDTTTEPPAVVTPVAPEPEPTPEPVEPAPEPEEPSGGAAETPGDGAVAPGENGSNDGSNANEGMDDGSNSNGSNGGLVPDGSSSESNASGGSNANEAAGGESDSNGANEGSGTATAPSDGSNGAGAGAEDEGKGGESGSGKDGNQDADSPKSEVVDANANQLVEPAAQEVKELPKQDGGQPQETAAPQTTSEKSGLTQTGDDATRTPLGAALVSACVAAIAGAALSMRRLIKRP